MGKIMVKAKERDSWKFARQVGSEGRIHVRNQADFLMVQKYFETIDTYLPYPFRGKVRIDIPGTFHISAVRIRAIGDREIEVGDEKTPIYSGLERRWIVRRGRAIDKGYRIKTFTEYAYGR